MITVLRYRFPTLASPSNLFCFSTRYTLMATTATIQLRLAPTTTTTTTTTAFFNFIATTSSALNVVTSTMLSYTSVLDDNNDHNNGSRRADDDSYGSGQLGATSLVSEGVLAFLRCRHIDIYGVHKRVKFLRHL